MRNGKDNVMRCGREIPNADRNDLLDRAVRLISDHEPCPEGYAVIEDMIVAHVRHDYGQDVDAEESTPRVSDLRNTLEAVKLDAERLRASFNTLVRKWDSKVDFLVPGSSRRAFAEALRPGFAASEIYESLPVMLDSIKYMAEVRLRCLGVDSGGNTNLWKSRFGSARNRLVFRAVHVLAVFKGKESLKGSDQGEAAELARIYLALAGEDPEAVDVTKQVKAAIREIRTNPVFTD